MTDILSGPSPVVAACEKAEAAFDLFRSFPAERRALLIEAIAEEILALGDELLDCAHAESRLPLARLTGERGRTVGQLRMFAQLVRSGEWSDIRIDPALPDRAPLPRSDLRLRKIGIGPIAVFGASNFPLAFSTAGGDTASALAAGCPVIVKGHPAHPQTHALVSRAIRAAVASQDLPEGVFGEVSGDGHEIGAALIADPRIAGVGFTGSRRGGLALMKLAQSRPVPIPVFAEMSSINPVILMPAALRARGGALGEAYVQSLTLGAGQFCTNPGLVLLIEGEGGAAFLDSAAAALSAHEPQPMLTEDIRAAYADGIEALSAHPAVAQISCGRAGDGAASEAARLFVADAADFLASPLLAEEIFGASSLVIRCRDLPELHETVAALEGQLTATLHLGEGDEEAARALLPLLERKAGRILVNGWPTGVEVSPAMVHGGPFPATSDGRSTSVGTLAINRFLRPVCYQDMPAALLPPELSDTADGPRLIDGSRR